MKAWEAARNALENVLEAVADENILVVCDEEKTEIGKAFAKGALSLGLWTRIMTLQRTKKLRDEIPKKLLKVFTQQKPDLCVNLLRGTREETPFRIKIIKMETRDQGSRLGHCPGITIDMLTKGALAFTPQEHKSMQSHAKRLIQSLNKTTIVEIRNPAGTNVTLRTEKRVFFTDTRLDWKSLKWINLPTGEVTAAPVEDSLNGKLVCDMAIGGMGKLKTPVEVVAKNGRVERVFSKNKNVLQLVKNTFETDDWSDTVGEVAFGINPKARFVNEFLEAEKILGTTHIAFGANTDMPGGKNPSKNHLDFLISKPTVKITKENMEDVTILKKGSFKI